MKAVEYPAHQEFDKSFIVLREKGKYFPCPWHYHLEYELALVIKSTGVRIIGDNVSYFDEGDLVFVGPLLPHLCINDRAYLDGQTETEAESIIIRFKYDFLGEKFFDMPEMKSVRKFLELSKQGIALKGSAREKVGDLMKRMLYIEGIQRLSMLLTIFDVMTTTNEYDLLVTIGYLQQDQLETTDNVSRVMAYIMLNFDRNISLMEIASMANMAVSTFCNFFKEHYGITFIEYLNTLRIGRACKLLTEDDDNVKDIAYKCGFNNLQNFNRQFKKRKKMTPREFRRRLHIEVPERPNFLEPSHN